MKNPKCFPGKAVTVFCMMMAIVLIPSPIKADNQLIPGNEGTSDPAPMVEGNKVYLYCTVDAIGNGDLSIYDITCYSTEDLYHWKYEGVVLTENDIPWAAKKGNLWAPHCIKLGGKFHLYFPANDGRTFRIGHAVADSPTGPFVPDRNYMAGCGSDAIDPFVLLDTADGGTGKAYIGWDIVGRTPNQVYLKELNSTYSDAIGNSYDITQGLGSSTRYKEGIWIIKQNNLWYCILADWTGAVESITYSTSTSLFGPYTKRGTILNENTNSATIHAGVVHFLGKWVIFYHTGGNEFGGTINTGAKRVTGAEYFDFNKSGNPWTIPQLQKTCRGVGVPFSYDTIQIDRHSPSGISGARVSVVGGGEPRGWMVSNISNDGYVRYNEVDFSTTDKSSGNIMARVASVSSGGSIEVRVGSRTGTLLGTVQVPSTGGLTKWQTVTAPVTQEGLRVDGINDLFCVFKTTAPNQYNVNWVSIGKQQSTGASRKAWNTVKAPFELVRSDIGGALQVRIPGTGEPYRLAVFNMNGQRVINPVSVAGGNIFTLLSGKGDIPSGKYVLLIKGKSGSFQVPFVY
ncbi:MAG TPA: family 43 glycosylhydrolase [Chitinispirillaceae bacterium]|nr:family 43 glycosylhydrolase [Chitinispirillaceae bacterium]